MHDVAVVGAGPAGAWAAHCLARRGASVLLIDPSHPREKPCGGGITGRALEIVTSAIDPQRIETTAIRRARFTARSSSRSADVPLPANALVVGNRADFDQRLLAAAQASGAALLNARALDVRPAANGFVVETSSGPRRASFVVGADGANSLVRRRVAQRFERSQLSIATGFFAHGVTSDTMLIEFTADPPGYIWSFPRPDHLAIGICTESAAGVATSRLRQILVEWIAATGVGRGARLQQYSWPIPSLPPADLDTPCVAGRGWCLVGDAAGLVDPITREGIYFALVSGQWAADAIASPGSDMARRYTSQVRENIGGELIRAARFKARFFKPAFTGLLIEALNRSAGVRAVMADLVAGRQTYAGLEWRLVKTLDFRTAIRLMRQRDR